MYRKHLAFLLFIAPLYLQAQQAHNEFIKPVYAAKLTHHIIIPDEGIADTVIFAVYSNAEDNNYRYIKEYFRDTSYFNYNVHVINTTNIYRLQNAHFIYFSENDEINFNKIYAEIRDGSFIITENFSDTDSLLINIIENDHDNKLHFELNLENIIRKGFAISPELINLVKKDIDLDKVFAIYEQKVNNLNDQLQEQRHILGSQEKVINYLANDIDGKKATIKVQTTEIKEKENELQKLQQLLIVWSDSVTVLKDQIRSGEQKLSQLSMRIALQNQKINEISESIDEKEGIIKRLDQSIDEKKLELEEQVKLNQQQSATINLQRSRIILILALFIVSSVLALVTFWFYRVKKRSNAELYKKNKSINLQKLKIEQQKQKIEHQNDELIKHRDNLEKLVQERTQELSIAKEKAEESNKLKTSFLTNMSHEIRTPLNAILGFTSLLVQDHIKNDEKKDFVKYVDTSARSLMNILDDILNISLIETDQMQLNYSQVDINEMLRDVQRYYQIEKSNIKKEHIEIILQEPDSHIRTRTDGKRLKQVLNNLIGNALKYTEEGRIEFGCTAQNGILQFYIKDSGIGISEQQQKYIFEPFNKIEEDKTKLYRGIGLGLSLSKKLINMLEGNISVNSEKGKGSTFYVSIPYKS
jgi:signal transduction histidine kinase